jgi:hypothetical protein
MMCRSVLNGHPDERLCENRRGQLIKQRMTALAVIENLVNLLETRHSVLPSTVIALLELWY